MYFLKDGQPYIVKMTGAESFGVIEKFGTEWKALMDTLAVEPADPNDPKLAEIQAGWKPKVANAWWDEQPDDILLAWSAAAIMLGDILPLILAGALPRLHLRGFTVVDNAIDA